ncbi:hypothetical protein RCL1_004937 [Eukaryota sp. TZLM3-RCL]
MGPRQTRPPRQDSHDSTPDLQSSESYEEPLGPTFPNEIPESTPRFPVTFRWPFPGQVVYVAGTFTLWDTRKIRLRPGPDRVLQLDLRLPAGRWQYKYVVDTEWRYSPSEPTVRDSLGNVNNVMNVVPPPATSTSLLPKPVLFSQNAPSVPTKAPPMLPPHLSKTVLNSNVPENTDPLLLPLPQHVSINHLYMWPRRAVLMLGTTSRYKAKTVTTVLYKPMSQELVKSLEQQSLQGKQQGVV